MWTLAGKTLNSRLICGTALYPSPEIMRQAIIASGAQVVTVALRRQIAGAKDGSVFFDLIKSLNVHVLPNTAGCRTSKEAITVAHMARELFNTNWIKLEVHGDDYTLQPDPFALLEATTVLIKDGFEVFPYTTSDLLVAQRLVAAGCKIIMPWGAPIGSGQGINDPRSLKILRLRLPEVALIVDAGIGKPSQATQVMEMGYDGIMLNSAIALAQKPIEMARAFAIAIESGRLGYESGFMEEREMASPSTPTIGTPFAPPSTIMPSSQTSRASQNNSQSTLVEIDEPMKEPSHIRLRNGEGKHSGTEPVAFYSQIATNNKHPIVWTIGGSDSGGGAGIQADIKAFNAMGVHGCSVITALTAQNTLQVQSVEAVSPAMIEAQIVTLLKDLPPRAVKTGMLYDAHIINLVAKFFASTKAFKLCDPVMVSTSGGSLLAKDEPAQNKATRALVDNLFPTIDLLTPNLPEAEAILGIAPLKDAPQRWQDAGYIKELARKLRQLGPKAVLIKGGHASGEYSSDYFEEENYAVWLMSKRLETKSTHGTGCTLSSVITACIALGYPLRDAVVIGKAYVNQGLRTSPEVGGGSGPITHGGHPETFADLPYLRTSTSPMRDMEPFPNCGNIPLGIYPIVDSALWLEKLLPLGFSTAQLRIKTGKPEEIEEEIVKSIKIAKGFNCRLFINDHWQHAITHGAYGVHLGQEDLGGADILKLSKSGIRLGISAHSYAEVSRTIAYKPSYIAIGPIYSTSTKNVPFAPQGQESLKRFRRTLPYPMVAIGGITMQRLPEVLSTGVDGIAVISDILQAKEPITKAKAWLDTYTNRRSFQVS